MKKYVNDVVGTLGGLFAPKPKTTKRKTKRKSKFKSKRYR